MGQNAMKKELIVKLHGAFEEHVHVENDVEFWLARDLQDLLGYEEWRKFQNVIAKAKLACVNSKHSVGDHFVDVGLGCRRR